MTEEEAKTKWCPHVRLACGESNKVFPDLPVFNMVAHPKGPGAMPNAAKCIASACMAWRWDMKWESATEEGQGGDLVLRLKPLNGKPRMGWCGLAGNNEA